MPSDAGLYRGEPLDARLRQGAMAATDSVRPGRMAIARPVICGLLRFFDWAWVAITAVLAVYVYTLVNPANDFSPPLFLLVGLVAAFSSNSLFNGLKLYEFARLSQIAWQLQRIVAGWAGVVFIGLSIAFLTKTSANFSRLWLVMWSVLVASGLLGARLAVATLIARWSASYRLQRQVAVVGSGTPARRLLEEC